MALATRSGFDSVTMDLDQNSLGPDAVSLLHLIQSIAVCWPPSVCDTSSILDLISSTSCGSVAEEPACDAGAHAGRS